MEDKDTEDLSDSYLDHDVICESETDGEQDSVSVSDKESGKQSNTKDSFSIIAGAVQASDNVEASMVHLNIWDQLMAARIKLQSVFSTPSMSLFVFF